MARNLLVLVFFILQLTSAAQQSKEDSLRALISKEAGDSSQAIALVFLARENSYSDSSLQYLQSALSLSRNIGYKRGEALVLLAECQMFFFRGDYGQTLKKGLDALSIYQGLNDAVGVASVHLLLQSLHYVIGDYRTALDYSIPGSEIARKNNVTGYLIFPDHHLAPLFDSEIAQAYVLMGNLDSALYYVQRSIDQKELFNGTEWNFPIYLRATIQTMRGEYADGLANYRKAHPLAISNLLPHDTLQINAGISTLFLRTGAFDSARHYANRVVSGWTLESEYKNLLEAMNNLVQVYKTEGRADSALRYVELAKAIQDTIFNGEKHREIQGIAFSESIKRQQIIADQLHYRNRVQLFGFLGSLAVVILVAWVFWRSSVHQKRAKIKLEQAYAELKTTQAQLIQSEKMASLGELTAGIAHELENPLNFVNNFSQINEELSAELRTELMSGKMDRAMDLAKSIGDNATRISQHGSRADAIIKGMLQHSRGTSSEAERVDINKFCEEYLRLAVNGYRGKDKSFNVKFDTEFDTAAGNVKMMRQDMGRVVLNMLNNAVYAVLQKKKENIEGYEPRVVIGTKRIDRLVVISIRDNGTGIPGRQISKVFQPFFTTKPPGEGTGLGLSLAYDIVQAHGGSIRVDSKWGEGTGFTIELHDKEA